MHDSGTDTAKNIRRQRAFCSKYKALANKKPFKMVLDWEEFNVGTPDVEFQVTLKQGSSFEQDDHQPTKGFASTEAAIIGIRNSYPCGCPFCVKPKK